MAKAELQPFPTDVLVDSTKSHEAVFVHPDQSIFADGPIAEAFDDIDAKYMRDREGRIHFMHDSVHRFRTSGTFGLSAPVDIAYLSEPQDAGSDEILLVESPLNDGRPRSDPDTMTRFVHTEDPSFFQIAGARPNSWGPTVKLDIGFQLQQAMGRPIPMAQQYSRLRPRAMSLENRRRLLDGDYTAYGQAAIESLRFINSLRREQGKTPVRKVHLFSAGMAQRGAGAGRYIRETFRDGQQDEFELASLTLMNLALRRGIKGTALDHMTQAAVNEASDVPIPESHVRIEEPLERQDQDHHGTDTVQMYGRQAWAIKDLLAATIPFATRYEPTIRDIESVMDGDIPVRLVNGLNVGMAIHTLHLLPVGDRRIKLSTIVGIEGQKVTMMSNEHAGVVAVAMSLGIGDYDSLQTKGAA